MRAIKSIKQSTPPNKDLAELMETFRQMINLCIMIGIKNNCSTLRRLSSLSYHELYKYDISSSYKINAISQACGRLSKMKREIKKGKTSKTPYVSKPYIINCYSIKHNGSLLTIPYKSNTRINILLNPHTQEILSDPTLKVRSFTITALNISICISKEITEMECTKTVGIDRNLRNVTVGNDNEVIMYKTNKLLSIKQNTIYSRAGFKRNDHRVKQKFWQEKNNRLQNRTKQYIHKISKQIVDKAVQEKTMIILEDLKGIRKLYRKGNGQGNNFRKKMNGWQFYELQRQIEYKAKWQGIPVNKVDPKRTSKLCPICGEKIQEDYTNKRKLLCINCGKSMDRDVVASMNIAHKGWARFIHPRGDTSEAQSSPFEEPMTERISSMDEVLIRIVDVSKSSKDLTEPLKSYLL